MRAFVLFLLISCQTFAQTNFFTLHPGHPSFSPLPPPPIRALEAEHQVALNVRSLVLSDATRRSFSVRLADGTIKVFQQKRFDGQEGFIPLGVDDVQPDPALPDTALSYYWYGISGTESLSFTVYKGRGSATLLGQTRTYQLTESRGRTVFRRFNPQQFATDVVGESRAPAFTVPDSFQMPNQPEFTDVISVLVLHTPATLALAGSRAQLNAEIAQAFGQSETTLVNSGITSFRLANVTPGGNLSQEIAYNETPSAPPGCTVGTFCRWVGHRVFARTSPASTAARNAANADLVVLIVADQLDATGAAYIQRPNCGVELGIENAPGCGVGAAYNNFAFSVVSYTYINSFQVFAHETGHQLGMEHDFTGSPSSNPSFSWSYGWYVNGLNETVMSIGNTNGFCTIACPRSLHYSNPNIPFVGTTAPSGSNSAFNARTAAFFAPAVSDFRNPQLGSNLIFRSAFEALPIP